MSEVTTRPATRATKAPARPKAPPSAGPTKPPLSEADTLAIQAAAIIGKLVMSIVEGPHGSSFAGFDEVVEADSIFMTLTQWGDPDGHDWRHEHDTIPGLLVQAGASVASALSKVLADEDCNAGERLERAVLLETVHDRMVLLTNAVNGLPGTLESLRLLTTFAGARQFRDRPTPPIRRIEEESGITGTGTGTGTEYSQKQLKSALEFIAAAADSVCNLLLSVSSADEILQVRQLVDAAEIMVRHIGASADVAIGGEVIGDFERWNYGPNFRTSGAAA